MEKKLDQLKELGLSEGQVKVYVAVLDLGVSTLNGIQEKTGIERRNIYDILNKLIERGFISYTLEKSKRTYQCTHPNKILEEIKKKEVNLDNLKNDISFIIPTFNAKKSAVRAEVYRGIEAMKSLHDEMLDYKEIYWIGGNSGVENTSLKVWFSKWMQRRVEKKVMMYDLVDYGTFLGGLEPQKKEKHKKQYYKYCQLPRQLRSPMVIAIFGNKVVQILWSEKPFAFVLESKEIKESFMKYFNYFWLEP